MINKGFSLIEIIVVLIIFGVLAAMALSSYFSWIEKSKAAEQIIKLKTLKDQIEACLAVKTDHLDRINCLSQVSGWSDVNFAYFVGAIDVADPNNTRYRIDVDNNTIGGSIATETLCDGSVVSPLHGVYRGGIAMCRNSNGSFSFSGWKAYSGI